MFQMVVILIFRLSVLSLNCFQIPVDDSRLMQLRRHQFDHVSHLVDLRPQQEIIFNLRLLQVLDLVQLAVHDPRHDQRHHSQPDPRRAYHL